MRMSAAEANTGTCTVTRVPCTGQPFSMMPTWICYKEVKHKLQQWCWLVSSSRLKRKAGAWWWLIEGSQHWLIHVVGLIADWAVMCGRFHLASNNRFEILCWTESWQYASGRAFNLLVTNDKFSKVIKIIFCAFQKSVPRCLRRCLCCRLEFHRSVENCRWTALAADRNNNNKKDLYSAIYKSHPGALTKLVTICSREEYSFEMAFK